MSSPIPPGQSRVLAAAGTISLLIALLQFVMYFGGAQVYRWCGTPESAIEFRQSHPVPALLLEILLFGLFATFAAYAYSGVGTIAPLPWLARCLAVTAIIYLGRGAFVIPQLTWLRPQVNARDILFSTISLLVGIAYGLVTYWNWDTLRRTAASSGCAQP